MCGVLLCMADSFCDNFTRTTFSLRKTLACLAMYKNLQFIKADRYLHHYNTGQVVGWFFTKFVGGPISGDLSCRGPSARRQSR